MVIQAFPNVEQADEDGLLAIGGDLEIASLILAYANGIFPWPITDKFLTWFAPPQRALLDFSKFQVSKSLLKEKKRNWARFAINTNFEQVIKSCSEVVNRGNQKGTWITPQIIAAYCELHKAGFAHSFECYHNGELVGGVYGVNVDQMFAAESMFYRKTNASKLALWFLIDCLKSLGLTWIDVQIINNHLVKLGAELIEREQFMKLLESSLKKINKPSNFAQQLNSLNVENWTAL